jgi:hypothetical protein
MYDSKLIKEQAKWEVELERFESAVLREKERIKRGRWWHRLIPFTVTIQRRNS